MPLPQRMPTGWKIMVETDRGPYLEHADSGSIFSPSGKRRMQVLNEEDADDNEEDGDDLLGTFSPVHRTERRKSPRLAAQASFFDPTSDETWDLAASLVNRAPGEYATRQLVKSRRPKPSTKKASATKERKKKQAGETGTSDIEGMLGGMALATPKGGRLGAPSMSATSACLEADAAALHTKATARTRRSSAPSRKAAPARERKQPLPTNAGEQAVGKPPDRPKPKAQAPFRGFNGRRPCPPKLRKAVAASTGMAAGATAARVQSSSCESM